VTFSEEENDRAARLLWARRYTDAVLARVELAEAEEPVTTGTPVHDRGKRPYHDAGRALAADLMAVAEALRHCAEFITALGQTDSKLLEEVRAAIERAK
jgi:hypothetical protein